MFIIYYLIDYKLKNILKNIFSKLYIIIYIKMSQHERSNTITNAPKWSYPDVQSAYKSSMSASHHVTPSWGTVSEGYSSLVINHPNNPSPYGTMNTSYGGKRGY
jgi:hypothetical protein